jgi:hypothetical protein
MIFPFAGVASADAGSRNARGAGQAMKASRGIAAAALAGFRRGGCTASAFFSILNPL